MATLTTPVYGFPYPDGAERVMDGDNAMGALAQAVEDRLALARIGVIVTGPVLTGIAAVATRLPLATAIYGRTAMLNTANNRVVIPAGGAGLWEILAYGVFANIAAGGYNRIALQAGDDPAALSTIAGTSPQPGGTLTAYWSMAGLVPLTDGQAVIVTALAAAADPGDFGVSRLSVRRVGDLLA